MITQDGTKKTSRRWKVWSELSISDLDFHLWSEVSPLIEVFTSNWRYTLLIRGLTSDCVYYLWLEVDTPDWKYHCLWLEVLLSYGQEGWLGHTHVAIHLSTTMPRGRAGMMSQMDMHICTHAHSTKDVWPEKQWLGHKCWSEREYLFHKTMQWCGADMISQVDMHTCIGAWTHFNQGVRPEKGLTGICALGHTEAHMLHTNIQRGWIRHGESSRHIYMYWCMYTFCPRCVTRRGVTETCMQGHTWAYIFASNYEKGEETWGSCVHA